VWHVASLLMVVRAEHDLRMRRGDLAHIGQLYVFGTGRSR
jgi:hypothetical protein